MKLTPYRGDQDNKCRIEYHSNAATTAACSAGGGGEDLNQILYSYSPYNSDIIPLRVFDTSTQRLFHPRANKRLELQRPACDDRWDAIQFDDRIGSVAATNVRGPLRHVNTEE